MRRATADALASLRPPKFYPAIDEVALGMDGTVLLRRGGPEVRGTRRWLVVGSSAEGDRSLDLPAGLIVHELNAESIWGVIKDQDDVPSVVRIPRR
jgi:hypothetical protein